MVVWKLSAVFIEIGSDSLLVLVTLWTPHVLARLTENSKESKNILSYSKWTTVPTCFEWFLCNLNLWSSNYVSFSMKQCTNWHVADRHVVIVAVLLRMWLFLLCPVTAVFGRQMSTRWLQPNMRKNWMVCSSYRSRLTHPTWLTVCRALVSASTFPKSLGWFTSAVHQHFWPKKDQ